MVDGHMVVASLLKMADLPVEVQEMLCTHETFRRLGFLPEEIKVLYTRGTPHMLHVVVQSQDKEFVCTVADWNRTQVEFEGLWDIAVRGWNQTFDGKDIVDAYNNSASKKYAVQLAEAMVNKGFKLHGQVSFGN